MPTVAERTKDDTTTIMVIAMITDRFEVRLVSLASLDQVFTGCSTLECNSVDKMTIIVVCHLETRIPLCTQSIAILLVAVRPTMSFSCVLQGAP